MIGRTHPTRPESPSVRQFRFPIWALITRHGRPLAALLPPEAAELWQAHQRDQVEQARRQAAADEQRTRLEEWGSVIVHPVAAVVRYQGDPASDDPLYFRETDQVPRPRRELRDLVEQLRPDHRSWMVEAWYEDDPRRPSPDSARFRNTARHPRSLCSAFPHSAAENAETVSAPKVTSATVCGTVSGWGWLGVSIDVLRVGWCR